jgi:hypothetical protein
MIMRDAVPAGPSGPSGDGFGMGMLVVIVMS